MSATLLAKVLALSSRLLCGTGGGGALKLPASLACTLMGMNSRCWSSRRTVVPLPSHGSAAFISGRQQCSTNQMWSHASTLALAAQEVGHVAGTAHVLQGTCQHPQPILQLVSPHHMIMRNLVPMLHAS